MMLRHTCMWAAHVAHVVHFSLSNTQASEKLTLSGVGLALPPEARANPRSLCTQTSDPIFGLPNPKASARSELPASR